MDVNGTRYHLLFGKEDWSRCCGPAGSGISLFDNASGSKCDWNDRYHDLVLKQHPFTFEGGAKSKQLTINNRRCAARDRYGNWFWIGDDEQRIHLKLSGSGDIVQFWSAADQESCAPPCTHADFAPAAPSVNSTGLLLRGLAITDDHYLVAGMLQPSGLLLFDLYSRSPPRRLLFPSRMDMSPFDCAPAPGGGVWLLDRKISADSPWRLWRIDGNFFMTTLGQESRSPQETTCGFDPPDSRFTAPFPCGIPVACGADGDAIAVEALPDGSAVMLIDAGEDFPHIILCQLIDGRAAWESTLVQSPASSHFPALQSVGRPYDCAFYGSITDAVLSGSLFIVFDEGNQAFRFELTNTTAAGDSGLTAQPEYFPMRLFGGKGIVAAQDGIYYDFTDGWIPLTNQAKPRFEQSGEFMTEVFDSGETDCVWHRCMFDAALRPETSIAVWSRVANNRESVVNEPWNEEPDPYKRDAGTELPFTITASATLTYDTWELLFQKAKGRYLQLRCRMTGDGRTTPELRALRIYYPRFSYLHRYIPSIYREDPDSASFLDRFLASFEGMFTSIEDRIAAVQMLIDYRSAPSEALAWLAGWLSIVFDPSWDEERRRLFIHNAPIFFRYRGTARGILMALRLGFGTTFEKTIDDAVFIDNVETAQKTSRIRIREHFIHRTPPRFTDPVVFDSHGPFSIDSTAPWTPREGGIAVSSRYRRWLSQYFGTNAIAASLHYPLVSPSWQLLDKKISVRQTTCAPVTEPADRELFKGYLVNVKNGSGTADDDHVRLTITCDLPGGHQPTVDDWNNYIVHKTAAWRQFSDATFGFVPSYFGREWNSWICFLAGRYVSIDALNKQYGTAFDRFESVPWPSDLPQEKQGEDWHAYLKATEQYSGAINRKRWTHFCARRYSRIQALNDRYGTSWEAFEQLPLPYAVPSGGAALRDWYQFESIILPMHETSHRFKVALPLTTSQLADPATLDKQLQLAKRIVDVQKPAHTVFDVRFYWAAFVVGRAHLGTDTVIDNSTRPPYFLTPMILEHGYLAESYLDSPYRPEQRAMIVQTTRLQEKSEFTPDHNVYKCLQSPKGS